MLVHRTQLYFYIYLSSMLQYNCKTQFYPLFSSQLLQLLGNYCTSFLQKKTEDGMPPGGNRTWACHTAGRHVGISSSWEKIRNGWKEMFVWIVRWMESNVLVNGEKLLDWWREMNLLQNWIFDIRGRKGGRGMKSFCLKLFCNFPECRQVRTTGTHKRKKQEDTVQTWMDTGIHIMGAEEAWLAVRFSWEDTVFIQGRLRVYA